MQVLVDIFKRLGALFMALIYFVLFVFVLGIDFCTFGILKIITWLICNLFKPFCKIQEKLFDFFNSHTTYNLWIFGWVTSAIGLWYMIVRFVHWLNDTLNKLFSSLYDKFKDLSSNIGQKGLDKLNFNTTIENHSEEE